MRFGTILHNHSRQPDSASSRGKRRFENNGETALAPLPKRVTASPSPKWGLRRIMDRASVEAFGWGPHARSKGRACDDRRHHGAALAAVGDQRRGGARPPARDL